MLKSLFISAYSELIGFAYFVKSKYSFKNKMRIFLIWIKISVKYVFLVKALRIPIKKENILGYKISAFDYDTIKGLFGEIFFRAQYFVELKNKKPILFDCGANIGFATVFFKWLYPESEVFAFEPDKDTFELLKNNISQNRLKNVNLFNVALTNKDGKLDFFVDNLRQGSLTMSEHFDRMSLKHKTSVDAARLSGFVKRISAKKIDLIKMDIEGSEKKAIEDLDRNNQLNKISNLIVEYHHKIGSHKSDLGSFLLLLEKSGFEYQINAWNTTLNSKNKFQDILIYAYK